MGPEQIDIISPDTIIMSISLPTLTVDDFNGDNLVENLAALLNIPPTKVIILNFVSDGSGGTTVEVEIGDEPASGMSYTNTSEFEVFSTEMFTSLCNFIYNMTFFILNPLLRSGKGIIGMASICQSIPLSFYQSIHNTFVTL
jgi:hypothetical protein